MDTALHRRLADAFQGRYLLLGDWGGHVKQTAAKALLRCHCCSPVGVLQPNEVTNRFQHLEESGLVHAIVEQPVSPVEIFVNSSPEEGWLAGFHPI